MSLGGLVAPEFASGECEPQEAECSSSPDELPEASGAVSLGPGSRPLWVRLAVLVGVVGVTVYIRSSLAVTSAPASGDLFVAGAAFVGTYALLVAALLPTLPMNLAAGALWGAAWGGILSVLGATLGAVTSFLVARYLLGSALRMRLLDRARHRFPSVLIAGDWRFIAFTRLNPVLPFSVLNYLFGLSPVSMRTYLVTTALAITPLCVLFATLGAMGRATILEPSQDPLVRGILIASGAVVVFVVVRYMIRRTPLPDRRSNPSPSQEAVEK